ncbi:MAG: sigma-70 family RNA polymerase sigma factor [Spirochaetes bacterium]|nr:sigma-70 family RNA polymerase sigma factor [Spirochaetota bacterium]
MTGGSGLSDEFLVGDVLDGNPGAFSELVRRHQRALYRLGLSFFRNGDDAADFTQDVFLKAYVNLGSFRGRSKFSTWLFRVAYNTAINSSRRKRRYEPLDDETAGNGLSTEDEHLRKETIAALKCAMGALPERQAVCLDLHFYYGMGYGEIAEVTGFPVNTIKSHVFRAKKELRISLDKEKA